MAKLQEMSTKLQAFSDTSEIDPALKKIQKSLKDDCGIDTEDSAPSRWLAEREPE